MPGRSKAGAARAAEPEFTVARLINAPRDRVFRAWTDADQFARWWGPRGFTTPFCKIDLRPGGVNHCCMRSPDGHDVWGKGIYREIVIPERLVSLTYFSDPDGNQIGPKRYGMPPEWPMETTLTITFEERDGGTLVTMRQSVPEALAKQQGADQGWNSCFDRLGELLTAK